MTVREGPRHQAVAQEALADDRRRPRPTRSPRAGSSSRTARPTSRCRARRVARRSRSTATRSRLAWQDRVVEERLRDHRDGHDRDGPGRAIRVHPGDELRSGDREPDAQAGQGVGLAGGPDDDEVRVVGAEAGERSAGELGVGLVEDDDRGRATVGDGIGQDAQRGARRSPRPVRPSRSGCSGCTARRRPPSRAAARTAGDVQDPVALAEPRDGDDRRAPLLRVHPVHRVRRDRDDRRAADAAGRPS